MIETTTRRMLGASVGLAVILTACSDGGSSASGDDLADYGLYSPSATGFTFHGAAVGESAQWKLSDEDVRRQGRVEELIAECMRDEGFDYVPDPHVPAEPTHDPYDEAYSLEPGEFVRTYGYGITTISLLPDVVDVGNEAGPNEGIRDSLSPTAQELYDTALWGSHGDDSGESEGCYEQSYLEVHGSLGVTLDEIGHEFGRLFDDVDALTARIWAEPRMADALRDWQGCLADKGYPGFDDLDGPRRSVFDRVSAVAVDEPEAGGAVPDDAGVLIEGDTRSLITPEHLADLRQHELDLAAADHECRRDHETTFQEVALDLEREFVDAHREELERYRDYVNTSGE